jgi:hypothetical protein
VSGLLEYLFNQVASRAARGSVGFGGGRGSVSATGDSELDAALGLGARSQQTSWGRPFTFDDLKAPPQTLTSDGTILYGPFTHRTGSAAVVDSIVATQELWGKEGKFAALAARAFVVPLDANVPAGQVEFFTTVRPSDLSMWGGVPTAGWRSGTPGTATVNGVVIVPITTMRAKLPDGQ